MPKTKRAPKLTHFDDTGNAVMVDVSSKEPNFRVAVAKGSVNMQPATLSLIHECKMKKGDVLAVAQLAGIMAAKRTPELIPLCHNIPIDSVKIEITKNAKKNILIVNAKVKTSSKTGVEIEALTSVAVSCLTIYDMCKYLNKSIKIKNIKLISKKGGKSVNFKA